MTNWKYGQIRKVKLPPPHHLFQLSEIEISSQLANRSLTFNRNLCYINDNSSMHYQLTRLCPSPFLQLASFFHSSSQITIAKHLPNTSQSKPDSSINFEVCERELVVRSLVTIYYIQLQEYNVANTSDYYRIIIQTRSSKIIGLLGN